MRRTLTCAQRLFTISVNKNTSTALLEALRNSKEDYYEKITGNNRVRYDQLVAADCELRAITEEINRRQDQSFINHGAFSKK